jgi:hypothetical protein
MPPTQVPHAAEGAEAPDSNTQRIATLRTALPRRFKAAPGLSALFEVALIFYSAALSFTVAKWVDPGERLWYQRDQMGWLYLSGLILVLVSATAVFRAKYVNALENANESRLGDATGAAFVNLEMRAELQMRKQLSFETELKRVRDGLAADMQEIRQEMQSLNEGLATATQLLRKPSPVAGAAGRLLRRRRENRA